MGLKSTNDSNEAKCSKNMNIFLLTEHKWSHGDQTENERKYFAWLRPFVYLPSIFDGHNRTPASRNETKVSHRIKEERRWWKKSKWNDSNKWLLSRLVIGLTERRSTRWKTTSNDNNNEQTKLRWKRRLILRHAANWRRRELWEALHHRKTNERNDQIVDVVASHHHTISLFLGSVRLSFKTIFIFNCFNFVSSVSCLVALFLPSFLFLSLFSDFLRIHCVYSSFAFRVCFFDGVVEQTLLTLWWAASERWRLNWKLQAPTKNVSTLTTWKYFCLIFCPSKQCTYKHLNHFVERIIWRNFLCRRENGRRPSGKYVKIFIIRLTTD